MKEGTSLSSTSKMRLFFGTESEWFQLFSIAQNTDGSIYFSAPMFQNIEWRLASMGPDQQPVLTSYQVSEQGKLSIHRSGVVHVKAHEATGSTEFAIRGNILKSRDGEVGSVRHLLTVYPAEPQYKPSSPPGARKTDCIITTQQWHPYVIVFWAVPFTRNLTTVSVNGSFQIDDLEEVPPNSGAGAFGLATHSVVWFAYRTKHMQRWPRKSQACYSDGHTVPVFVGTGLGEFRLEYRQPHYSLVGDTLSISLSPSVDGEPLQSA
jgi:hypothetical protein